MAYRPVGSLTRNMPMTRGVVKMAKMANISTKMEGKKANILKFSV